MSSILILQLVSSISLSRRVTDSLEVTKKQVNVIENLKILAKRSVWRYLVVVGGGVIYLM